MNAPLSRSGRRIAVVSNPNSGKNRRDPSRLQALREAVEGHGILRQTRSPTELRGVVQEFLDGGYDYWVCDGGDGSLHWLLTAVHELGCPFPAIIPANGGTIDFVAAKAGIRGQAVDVVRALSEMLARGERPPTVELDTLRFTGLPHDPDEGAPVARIGFAAAVGGVAQRFFGKLYQHRDIDAWKIVDVMWRATAGSVAAAAPSGVRPYLAPELQRYAGEVFEPLRARIEVDGKPLQGDAFSAVQVGSIDINLGGVVRTFRHAAKGGVLHAQVLGGSALGVVANLPNVILGTPIWGETQFDGPAVAFRAVAEDGACIDPVLDGEAVHGLREVTIDRGPRLQVPVVATVRGWSWDRWLGVAG